VLLDILGNYEEVIHFYMQTSPSHAERYVYWKKTPEVTSLYLNRLARPPLDDWFKERLIQFLNDTDANIFDHGYTLAIIPKEIELGRIAPYLYKAFVSVT